jgi:hypothetical protein
MAITISGNGTISGVSVGGLPDGVVDSGTLATGIDATKLADGTVTSAELQYINSLSSNAQTQISAAGGPTTQVAMLSKTHNLTAATGTFSVTGVGFVPEFVFILGGTHETLAASWGFGTSGSARRMIYRKADQDRISGLTTEIAYAWESGSHRVLIDLNSMDSDGATFGNTLVGSGAVGSYTTFQMYMYFMRFSA